jgi:hypothetical protein
MKQILRRSGGPTFKTAASDEIFLRLLPMERRAGDARALSCVHSVPDVDAEMHDPHNLGETAASHALNDASLFQARG